MEVEDGRGPEAALIAILIAFAGLRGESRRHRPGAGPWATNESSPRTGHACLASPEFANTDAVSLADLVTEPRSTRRSTWSRRVRGTTPRCRAGSRSTLKRARPSSRSSTTPVAAAPTFACAGDVAACAAGLLGARRRGRERRFHPAPQPIRDGRGRGRGRQSRGYRQPAPPKLPLSTVSSSARVAHRAPDRGAHTRRVPRLRPPAARARCGRRHRFAPPARGRRCDRRRVVHAVRRPACRRGPATRSGRPLRPSVSELIFTSGTEAEPKAIMHTEQTANFQRPRRVRRSRGDDRRRRRLDAVPGGPFDGLQLRAAIRASTTACPWCCRIAGTRDAALALATREGCSYTLAATTFLQDLVECARCAPARLSTG